MLKMSYNCNAGNNIITKKQLQYQSVYYNVYFLSQDVQHADIDHFDENKDFTVDPVNFGRLPEYFRNLQDNGMRTVIILVS